MTQDVGPFVRAGSPPRSLSELRVALNSRTIARTRAIPERLRTILLLVLVALAGAAVVGLLLLLGGVLLDAVVIGPMVDSLKGAGLLG